MPGYANPQNLNRYSYVTNNPLRYTDPTGHMRVQDGPVDDDFSQSLADEYEPLPDPEDEDDDYCSTHPTSCGLPPALDTVITLPAGGDYCSTHPGSCGVPITLPSLLPNASNNFWAVASAFGDIAFGGFFTSLSVYALVASCVYAGPACLITAPIFFTTAVIGAQVFVNGIQSLRQMHDSSIEPTGREVIDLVFPFLKEKR